MKKSKFLQPTPKKYKNIRNTALLIGGLAGAIITAPVSGVVLSIAGIVSGVSAVVATWCQRQTEINE